MKIDLKKLPKRWLEDKEGNKSEATYDETGSLIINDNQHIFYLYATQYIIEELKPVLSQNVSKCNHSKNKIKTNPYNNFNCQHRQCEECGAHQSRDVGDKWPSKWNDSGTMHVHSDIVTWSQDVDLVTSIVRSGDYNAEEAILIVTNACEECLYELYRKYGVEIVRRGWMEGLRNYKHNNCKFCKD